MDTGKIILNRRLRLIMKECLRRCMCLLKVMLCAYLIYIAYRTWETGVSGWGGFEPPTRGEIRAPFGCKAGYSKAGEGQIECTSEEGYVVRIYLISEIDTGWQRTQSYVDIRLTCGDGEKVRKGRLLAEYPYETLAGRGETVYAVLEVHSDENADTGHSGGIDKGYQLKINRREKVNYEYVACELVV